MANPVNTARGVPSGPRLQDGFRTYIASSLNPTAAFWEVDVKPPGMDGKEPIDTTTMHNVKWRSMAPRQLITLTPSSGKAAYDPVIYTDLLSILNIPCSWTVTFPNGDLLSFFGWLQKFETESLEEGKMPMATYEITPSNYDPVNQLDVGPLFTPASGT